jgi:hypothetical protein
MARKPAGETSKADMVRDAIAKLGWNAGPTAMHEYIQQTYGVDMSKAHISQTVSNERKRQGVRGRRRRRGRKPGGAEPAASSGGAKVADILSFVDAIRKWEAKLGADSVREVVKTVLRK